MALRIHSLLLHDGQLGEYRVAAELARCGFTVAMPSGNAPHIDILAYRHGVQIAIQVKATRHSSFQLNLGKFLEIESLDDGRQNIIGLQPSLDDGIIMAFVFVAEECSQDEFIWMSLIDFAKYLSKEHQAYLDGHGGRRPGKNPKSMHAAISRKELGAAFPVETVEEYLGGV